MQQPPRKMFFMHNQMRRDVPRRPHRLNLTGFRTANDSTTRQPRRLHFRGAVTAVLGLAAAMGVFAAAERDVLLPLAVETVGSADRQGSSDMTAPPRVSDPAFRRVAADPDGTQVRLPWVIHDGSVDTHTIVMNGSREMLDVRYTGREPLLGQRRARTDSFIDDRGTENAFLSALFSRPVSLLDIGVKADVYGKFVVEEIIKRLDGRTASALDGTKGARHALADLRPVS